MTTPPDDYLDMVRALNGAGCEYIIVGAYALAANGHPRATQDIDFFVRPTVENAQRVYTALLEFGAPVDRHGVSPGDLASRGTVYQIGVAPVRIDILTEIHGLEYDEAARSAVSGWLGPEPVRFIGLEEQIVNKRAAGRTQDIADAEALEAIRAAKKRPSSTES